MEENFRKWRKSKKDLDFQLRNIEKCQSDLRELINQKNNDVKCIDREIEDYIKRINNNNNDSITLRNSMNNKIQSSNVCMYFYFLSNFVSKRNRPLNITTIAYLSCFLQFHYFFYIVWSCFIQDRIDHEMSVVLCSWALTTVYFCVHSFFFFIFLHNLTISLYYFYVLDAVCELNLSDNSQFWHLSLTRYPAGVFRDF